MIKVGIQRVNITPPIGTPLGGYIAREDVSQGIHDDLWAEAIVIEGGNSSVAIVVTDLLGLDGELVRKIRESISRSINLSPSNIMVAATHTHSGPDLLLGYQGKASTTYIQKLTESITGAVNAAWQVRSSMRLGAAQGSVEGVGANRRSANGLPIDPHVGVLRFDREGSQLAGIVVNYTCHATVLGPDNLLISADYPGYMRNIINKLKGPNVITAFTNGAAGDINPGYSAELSALGAEIPGRTFERAEQLGTMLAGEVLKVLETIEPAPDVPIAVRVKEVPLSLKPLPTAEQAEATLHEKEITLSNLLNRGAPIEVVTKAKIERLHADLLVKQIQARNRSARKGSMKVELQAIRIGDCALLAFPGELFVEIGLRIKDQSPFKYTYIVGYANGYIGYIPTKEAFDEGGYETVAANFTPESAEIIEKESAELLQSLY